MANNLRIDMGLDLKKAYLLLGSNLGNREQYLSNAIDAINKNVGSIYLKSSIYETEAWGKTDQPGFLNLAIAIETRLTPIQLLESVLSIEAELGRVRHEKWGARMIDIDIIFYEDQIVNDENILIIPHPEMQNRKFVLEPLAEIAPNFIHPIFKRSILQMLKTLCDPLAVEKR